MTSWNGECEKLSIDHAETRWLALRLDDDVKEIHAELRVMDTRLVEHSARFDSVDMRLRSLTQLVGEVHEEMGELRAGSVEVLRRLPEPGNGEEPAPVSS